MILCFFFNDTATTEIYTLSLHDALPILTRRVAPTAPWSSGGAGGIGEDPGPGGTDVSGPSAYSSPSTQRSMMCRAIDRKSTRLNSSHANISYAVFCLKKKKTLCSVTIS